MDVPSAAICVVNSTMAGSSAAAVSSVLIVSIICLRKYISFNGIGRPVLVDRVVEIVSCVVGEINKISKGRKMIRYPFTMTSVGQLRVSLFI